MITTPVGNTEFRNAKNYWLEISGISYHTLRNNSEVRFAAKYVIVLCVEASIQIGKYMLKELHLEEPEKNIDVFQILYEQHIIHFDLAKKLKQLVLFRNIIVHDYAGVDIEKLELHLERDIFYIEEFQEIALKWERKQNGGSIISQMYNGAGIKTVFKSILKM